MTIEEIEERKAQIAQEMETEGADLDALLDEVRSLNTQKDEIENRANKREELRSAVAQGEVGETVKTFKEERKMDEIYAINSEEYRTAWLKNFRGDDLNEMEKRAFTVSNGAISQLVVNDIMSVVRDHAPLLSNITCINSGAKITYYVEGTNADAADHKENAAITAAGDTLAKVELTPAEIVKMVQVSESAQAMSIAAFGAWLTRTLGEAIARNINGKIVKAIADAATSAGTDVTAASVQALLGSVKGDRLAVICNRKTLFTGLLPLQDNSKHSLVSFAGSTASIYGVPVLVDDNAADGVVLAGDMTKAVAAIGENVAVRNQYDINTNSYKYLGVALFDVKVGQASAFAKLAKA